jgi:hypothetical protein
MSYLSIANLDTLRAVTAVPAGPQPVGAQVAFRNPDQTWVSIQPDGSEQTRPAASTPGAYELATVIAPGLVIFIGNNAEGFLRKYVP